METVWVAMERIVDAEANIPIQQVNILRGVAHGVPVFLVGAVISAMLTELYYAALESFRGKTAPQ